MIYMYMYVYIPGVSNRFAKNEFYSDKGSEYLVIP